MRRLLLPLLITIPMSLSATPASRLITQKSVGPVKLGMTVATARKALRGFTLSRTSDAEGVALIGVMRGKKMVMSLYAGEDNAESKVKESAIIENIEVYDAAYKTKSGVHPGMLLKDVEGHLGRLKQVLMSEIESREYATFARGPAGMIFRVMGKSAEARRYTADKQFPRTATGYSAGAYLYSISIEKSR